MTWDFLCLTSFSGGNIRERTRCSTYATNDDNVDIRYETVGGTFVTTNLTLFFFLRCGEFNLQHQISPSRLVPPQWTKSYSMMSFLLGSFQFSLSSHSFLILILLRRPFSFLRENISLEITTIYFIPLLFLE